MTFPTFIKLTTSIQLDHEPPMVAPLEKLTAPETPTVTSADDSASFVSALSEAEPTFRVHAWDKKSRFSDYIKAGLESQNKPTENVVMLFESPSSTNPNSTFYNDAAYRFHDYPVVAGPPSKAKSLLGPCRYSLMNGTACPTYLKEECPPGLLHHWKETVPGFVTPNFVSEITDEHTVYAYLPCETIKNHVNAPYVHYHLAGKEAIALMTKQTTALFPNTKVQRPCIAKTTHSMASKGIFVIRNDQDEADFEAYLQESGHPTFVVADFVDIDRNVACHFFIHPNGEVTFFGSNENHRTADGNWSMDSYLIMQDQDELRELQLPFVQDVAKYCLTLGFWGFVGVDVLLDKTGRGYLVDVNPRVTGSCPSLLVAQMFQDKYGYNFGLFRRNGDNCFHGTQDELFAQVSDYNAAHEGSSKIVLFSVCENSPTETKVNMGVYGHSLDECRSVINHFAKAKMEC